MSDREERIGWWISGVAHAALILWALLGGVLFRPQPSQPVRMTEVATMSGAEFEEYAAASRGAGPVAPDATAVAEISEPETEDAPAAAPSETAAPDSEKAAQELAQPDASEAQPDLSDFEPREPVNVATDLPDTPAAPEPVQETAPPAPAESTQPQADAQPSRPAPSEQDESAEPVAPRSVLALDQSTRPQDRPDGLVEAFNARVAEQEAAREAAEQASREAERLATEAAEAAERQAAEQARQEAEAAVSAEREAEARAEEERRAAEQAAREEEQRRAEE
ncbi:protein TolA, partial [Paracoccus methylarcula]